MNSASRSPPVSPFAIQERASGEDDHDQENAGPKSHALLYPIRYAVRGPSQPAPRFPRSGSWMLRSSHPRKKERRTG
jgi:hypothetical protein